MRATPTSARYSRAYDDSFEQPEPTYPNGTHVAEVEIDPETGVTTIVRYHVVDDFGATVNPLLLEGQVHGGIAQGVGQALYERTSFDEDGQLLTATFLDYAMPRADDFPPITFETRNVPCATNAFGIKGAGEAGAIGSSPAVMNAVIDALDRAYGIAAIDMPATPEKVWTAIQAAPLAARTPLRGLPDSRRCGRVVASMNTQTSARPLLGIALKSHSTLAFTGMATLIKLVGTRYPVGEIVFFRSFFALIPVFVWVTVRDRRLDSPIRIFRTGNIAGHLAPLDRRRYGDGAWLHCADAPAHRRRHRHRLRDAAGDGRPRRGAPAASGCTSSAGRRWRSASSAC